MSSRSFEDRYIDTLQNIEFFIVQVYREHPELCDRDSLSAVEALIRLYQAQAKGRTARFSSMPPLAQEIYQRITTVCDWRLGRESLLDSDDDLVTEMVHSLSLGEVITYLKRNRKSINRWTRVGGRQGYLNFIDEFIY